MCSMNNQTLVLLINLDRDNRLDKMIERLGNLPFTKIVALD